MRTYIKRLFVTALAATTLLAPVSASAATGTGAASLSFSPSNGTYTVGSIVTVSINENSSVAVAAVEADFSYPSTMLECAGTDLGGSAFPTAFQNTCGGGSVSLAQGVQGTPVSGSQHVATVSFKVIGSGSAALTVAGSSEIDDATTANVCNASCAAGSVAASFTLNAAPTTGGMGAGPTTGSTNSTGSISGSTAAKSGTASTGSSAAQVDGATTTTPATTTTTPKTSSTKTPAKTVATTVAASKSRTGMWVTSGIIVAALAAAGAYLKFFRKPVEAVVATAKKPVAKRTPAKAKA